VPEWLFPALSVAGAIVGGWLGVKITVTRLETQMESVLERLKVLGDRSHSHNDVILTHDAEIDEIMRRLDMDRAPRRRKRDER
jgi:hypothetical protein